MKTIFKMLSCILVICMMLSVLSVSTAGAQTNSNVSERTYGRINSNVIIRNNTSRSHTVRKDIPSKYDSRNYGFITSVKNQGEYGSCWSFASLNACEASLIKNHGYNVNNINLAETHLCYSAYTYAYDRLGLLSGDKTEPGAELRGTSALDIGGNIYTATMTLARWQGAVDEVDNPAYAYSTASPYFNFSNTADAYSLNKAQLTDAYWVDIRDRDSVKSMIMQYGAGDFGYFHDDYDRYYDATYNSYCYIQAANRDSEYFQWPNHEVSIVGWDDTFPRENFSVYSRPTNNGAWLCKNSWSADWGDNGYFWISYEDSSISEERVAFYELSGTNLYDNNYQYDGSVNSVSRYDTEKSGSSMANVFTAQGKETLKAVSFYTYEDNVSYNVSVYTGLKGTDPTDGTKVVSNVTGELEHAGYHTIELPNSVFLNAGNKFSVVVRLYDRNYSIVSLACDYTYDEYWYIHTSVANDGQSYLSLDGKTWSDVSQLYDVNFRIKAFTVNGHQVATDTSTDTTIDTSTDTITSDTDTTIDTESDLIIFDTESDVVTDSEPVVNAKGDINNDGGVNMEDVVMVQKYIARLTTFKINEILAANVDNDNNITMVDVTTMQKYVARLIDSFPSEESRSIIRNRLTGNMLRY